MDIGLPPRPTLRLRSKRRLTSETILSRRLEFETLEPRVLMSADLLPFHGMLDVPGQVNQYTFNLASAQELYLDSQTPHSDAIDWTLQGPQGTVVDHQSLENTDAFRQGGTATLSLVPGDYKLSVSGQNNATGAYDFQLLNLANAAPITPGQRVDGTLDPGDQTKLYQFNGTAGEQVFFDSQGLDPQSTAWRVVGPENQLVFGPTGLGNDPGTTTLERTGSYTVLIEGNVDQTTTADYSFAVYPVATHTANLALGQTTVGNLLTPGQTDQYSFTVGQTTTALFDSLTNRGDVQWSLTGPGGTPVSQRAFAYSDADRIGGSDAVTLPPGSYTLTVNGVGNATGGYGFRLTDLSTAAPANLSDTQSGVLDDGGSSAIIAHGDPGAPITGDTVDRSLALGTPGVAATVPNSPALQPASLTVEAWINPSLSSGGTRDIVRQGAPGAGYALVLADDGTLQFEAGGTTVAAPTTLRLGVWTHVAGTFDGTTLHLLVNGQDVADAAAAGPIAYDAGGLTIGAADAAGDDLWQGQIDELRVWNTARAPADIAAARGQSLGPQAGLVADYHFDEAAGTALADSSGNGLTATLGNVPATGTTLLAFSLVAGQSYLLDAPNVQNGVTARLFNPAGTLVLGPTSLQNGGSVTADVTGTYVLALEGDVANTGAASYDARLVPSGVAITASLTLGSVVSDSIGLPSQSAAYTFTLGGETKLLFDTLGAEPGLAYSLTGPRGTEVAGQSLREADGPNSPAATLMDLPAGDYTLTIFGDGRTTGPYSFRLLDAAAATAFTLGDDVTAAVDQPGGNLLYSFTAQAGDTVSFNVEQGQGSATWRLLDPYGRPVFGPTDSNSQTGVVLGATGTYLLSIEGSPYYSTQPTVEFASSLDSHTDPAAATGTPIALGGAISGGFALDGTADYTVTVAAGAQLYFDSQTNDGNITWSLTGPRGTEVGPTPLNGSDSFQDGNDPVIALPLAGTYQIHLVQNGGDASYAFSLLDLSAAAAAPTDGSAITGTLNPANATAAYSVAGTAGTNLFLDTGYNYDVSYRLIDPYGRQVAGPATLGGATLPIAVTGTYTLLVEGAVYLGGTRDYSFSLTPIADPATLPLSIGSQTAGTVAAPGETNRYSFNTTGTTQLVLTSTTTDGNASITLTGPDGIVFTRNLSDAQNYPSGSPVVTLGAGNYTVAITSQNGSGSTDYGFRFVDLASAVALTPGTTYSATLDPKITVDVYTVAATAGTQLRVLQNAQYYGGERLIVLGPDGSPLAPAQGGNLSLPIATTGTYTILVEGRTDYGDTPLYPVSYTITAYDDPAPTAISPGLRETGTLADGNSQARYTLSATAGQQIVFDSFVDNGSLHWTLSGPDGAYTSNNFNSSDGNRDGNDPVITLVSGAYTLTITSDNGGAFDFRLLDLASATALGAGNAVTGAQAPGNGTTIYSFAATAGVPLDLTTTDPNQNLTFRVLDAFGRQVLGPQGAGQQLFTPSVTGTYYVLVEGTVYNGAASNPFTVSVQPVPQQTVALTGLDSPKGPFSVPGQVGSALAFTGQDTVAVPDGAATDLGAAFTIEAWIDPDTIQSNLLPIVAKLSPAGQPTYALFLDNGDRISFLINDGQNSSTLYTNYGVVPIGAWTHIAATVDPSTHQMTLYLNGVQVAQQGYGSFNPPATGGAFYVAPPPSLAGATAAFEGGIDEVRLWTVALTAAQVAATMNTALAGNEAGLALDLPLDEPSGAATVADKGPYAATGIVSHEFGALTNVVEGRIGTAFETDRYTFTLPQAGQYVLDGLSDNDAFTVTLTGPNGLTLTRTIDRSDSLDYGNDPLLSLAAGSYTLAISSTSTSVGSYAFRLLDLSGAVPMALDTPVTATLTAGFVTQAFAFQATAGTRFLFNPLSLPVNDDQVSFRILDPLGRQVYGPSNFDSRTDIPTLALTGTYTLLIEGRASNRAGPITLGFALDTYVTRAASLTVGAPNPAPGPIWGGLPTAGTGLTLTGADEITVPNGPVVQQTGSMTLEATVRIDRLDNSYVPIATEVSADGTLRAYGLYVRNDGALVGTVQDANGDFGFASNGGAVTTGRVSALAMVVDRAAGTLTLYVNGVQVGSQGIRTQPTIAVDGPLVLGATNESSAGYSRLVGAIGQVRLWSVARSAADVLADAAAEPAANSAGLVLDLPFAEGSGTTSANIAAPGGQATLVNLNTDGITGDLQRPGLSDAYAFTLGQTTRLLVDSLTANNTLRWTINGPYGVVASNLLRYSNGYDAGGNNVIVLPAGSYTFTISGDSNGQGFYNVRLLDIDAQATPLTLGTAVSGVLDPAGRTAAYSFTAAANDTFFFDAGGTGGEVSWRLIGPDGVQLNGPTGLNNTSLTLPKAGTWIVLVESRANDGGRATYSFTPIISPTVTTALTLGARVDGTIAVPSETDAYTFTLAAPGQLAFDSLTPSNAILWSLTGPDGTVVNRRGFGSSDSGNIGGSTVLELPAGTYTLAVQGDSASTGAYAFRLLDVTAGTALALDTPVVGNLGDGGAGTDVYRFTATARERVDFHGDSNSSAGTNWRLVDPYGNLVFGPNQLVDSGPLTLGAGTYTLLVEGAPAQTGGASYGFTVQSVAQQSAAGQTTQDFDTAGLLPYTLANFTGPAAAVDPGATGNALQLTTLGDRYQDNAVYFPVTTDSSLQQVTVDLDFTINQGGGDRDSSLVVALLDANTWGNSGTGPDLFTNAGLANSLAIAFDTNNDYGGDGSSNHIAIRGGGGLISQQFVTPANVDLGSGLPVHATITVAQTDGGALVTVVLTPQGGMAFTAVSGLFVANYQLHALRVAIGGENQYDTATQTVDNIAVDAQAGADPAQPITLGQVVSGSILVPNAVEHYSFAAAATTQIVFDNLSTDSDSFEYSITGPSGTVAAGPLYGSDGVYHGGPNLLTLPPGQYEVTISRDSGRTGAFAFRLLDASLRTTVSVGDVAAAPTTVTLDPGGETALLGFQGTAGQVVYFDNLAGRPDVYVRILDPNGNLVFGPGYIDNIGPITLTATGSYLLELEGFYSEAAAKTVSFVLVDATDRINPLTLGQAFTGSVAEPGQRDVHTFTLAQGTVLYPDSLTADGNVTWSLYGPDGLVASRSFTNTDGIRLDGSNPGGFYVPAGNYQFVVTRNGNGTGDYQFNLLDLAAAPALTLGTPLSTALAPADSTLAYAITAADGQALHLSANAPNNTSLRLLDSAGRLVAYTDTAAAGLDTPVLAAGRYTLLVEGDLYAGSGTQAVTVRGDEVTTPAQATSLGALVEATIATPGQRQVYTFSVATPSSVLIDPLGYDGRFNWSLTLLNGTVVTRSFDQSSGTYNYYNYVPNPVLLLGPGNYTLSIGASQNATGTAALRIIDGATAPVITPGLPVSGTLSPVGADNVYQFNGTQGQQFYFAALAQAGGSATWKLLDPSGNLVFDQGFGDAGLVTLPLTGSYLLVLLDENNDYAPPLTYTFNLFADVPAAPVPAVTADTAAEPDLQVQSLAISAPGGVIQSGSPVTVSWMDANAGTLGAAGTWTDRVVIRNVATGAIIAEQLVPTDGTTLAAGGTVARSVVVPLPPGGIAVGQLLVTVTADATNAVAEHDAAGDAEANNAASATVTAVLAAYPDLVATNLAASPAGAYVPGQPVTVTWITSNIGTADTANGWTEQLIVRDVTTGHQVAEATVVQPAGLAQGGSLQRSVTITWPSGADATGQFSFVVTVDSKDEVFEANPAGTGESNDRTELDVLSAPDLTVNGLQLAPTGTNLLVNPGFEGSYAGWTTNPEATGPSTATAPFDGTGYFFAGSTAAGFAQQTVSLLSATVTAAGIDAGQFDVSFGGTLRSYPQTPADHGTVTLTFLDANGTALSAATLQGTDSQGSWTLTGQQVAVPAGARSVTYLFTATRLSGSDDDAYLDDSFVRVVPHGSAPATPQSGGQLTLQWTDVNGGTAATPRGLDRPRRHLQPGHRRHHRQRGRARRPRRERPGARRHAGPHADGDAAEHAGRHRQPGRGGDRQPRHQQQRAGDGGLGRRQRALQQRPADRLRRRGRHPCGPGRLRPGRAGERPGRDVAREAGVSFAALYARAPGRRALLLALSARLDRQALEQAEGEDAPSPRDRLFEAFMSRLEVMAPHRDALLAVGRSEGVALAPALPRTARALAEGAGVDTSGARGALRVAALTGAWARTLQVWRDDEGALNRTMAEIDKLLTQADRRLARVGAGF